MDPPCLLFEYCAKSSLDTLLRAGLENPQVGGRAGGRAIRFMHEEEASSECLALVVGVGLDGLP